MNPSTNFGKRSQSWAQIDGPRRAPMRTFWEALTIVAIWSDSSPTIAPLAATAAVVSMLPPIQAPATAFERPRTSTSHGSRKIDGSRGEQHPQLVVQAGASPEPPREQEHDGDEDQGLRDRRPGRAHDHRDVDRRSEQDEAGLDEELRAERGRQPVADAEPGDREARKQAEDDRVDRVLDRADEIAVIEPPGGVLLLEVARHPRQAADRARSTARKTASARRPRRQGAGRPRPPSRHPHAFVTAPTRISASPTSTELAVRPHVVCSTRGVHARHGRAL